EQTGNEVTVPPTGRRLGLVEFAKRTVKEIGEDHLAAFAGNLTYKGLFALFPFFVFMLSLLGLFGAPDLLDNLLEQARAVLPEEAFSLLEDQLIGIAESRAQSAFTVGAVVSLLLALWGVSGAFRSMMEAMNVMYEVEEARPFWKVYGMSVFLSLGIAALLLTALALVVFGPEIGGAIADVVGLGYVFEVVWNIVKWPVLIAVVLFAFALVYYFAPDVEQRFRYVSPGSIMAVVMWLLFSLLFRLYVESFGSFGETFGSFAGIIVLMLYIYYTSFIILVGAEMNQVIEEYVPEGKNEGEKTLNTEQQSSQPEGDGTSGTTRSG
ncbi:MAG: YihY/virulence factor BrkB family protein, partial [Actinomycetota bacterium]|nr:YihY/virulence factor BrkB family protein [Actinomycetota bacterium]